MKRSRIFSIGLLSLLVLAGCGKKVTVRKDVSIGKDVIPVMLPAGKEIIHPVHGKEVWFAIGPMSGVGNVNANGVAQSHVFADGATIATVNLNIHAAPAGSRFVGWLQKPGATERVRLDVLQRPFNNVRHFVTVDVAKDLRAYTEVIVTLEKNAGAWDLDPVQAKGTLIVRTR